MSRCLKWGVLLVLVGQGQEIKSPEYNDLTKWVKALRENWKVACPEKLKALFPTSTIYKSTNHLNLTVSLRSHISGCVSDFINALIEGDIERAKGIRKNIGADFSIYITRSLDQAKEHCRNRYEGDKHKHYGLLTSSKGWFYKWEQIIAMRQQKGYTKKNQCGPWFSAGGNNEGAAEKFDKVATEYTCQGLELDLPIVCWKSDVLWSGKEWRTVDDKKLEDRKHRLNSYRVLLTRGRDGMIIYIPNERCFQHTYKLFSDDLDIEELR